MERRWAFIPEHLHDLHPCKAPVGTHNKDHSEKGLFSQGLAFFSLLALAMFGEE